MTGRNLARVRGDPPVRHSRGIDGRVWPPVNERVAEGVTEPELKRAGRSKTRHPPQQRVDAIDSEIGCNAISGEKRKQFGVRGIRLAQLLSTLSVVPAASMLSPQNPES